MIEDSPEGTLADFGDLLVLGRLIAVREVELLDVLLFLLEVHPSEPE